MEVPAGWGVSRQNASAQRVDQSCVLGAHTSREILVTSDGLTSTSKLRFKCSCLPGPKKNDGTGTRTDGSDEMCDAEYNQDKI